MKIFLGLLHVYGTNITLNMHDCDFAGLTLNTIQEI